MPKQYNPSTSFEEMRDWFENHGGREIVRKRAVAAREAGRQLSESLQVSQDVLDEPMDF